MQEVKLHKNFASLAVIVFYILIIYVYVLILSNNNAGKASYRPRLNTAG